MCLALSLTLFMLFFCCLCPSWWKRRKNYDERPSSMLSPTAPSTKNPSSQPSPRNPWQVTHQGPVCVASIMCSELHLVYLPVVTDLQSYVLIGKVHFEVPVSCGRCTFNLVASNWSLWKGLAGRCSGPSLLSGFHALISTECACS